MQKKIAVIKKFKRRDILSWWFGSILKWHKESIYLKSSLEYPWISTAKGPHLIPISLFENLIEINGC